MDFDQKKTTQHYLIKEKKLKKELETLCWNREAEGFTEETGLYNSPEIKNLIKKLQTNREDMIRCQKRQTSELKN